MADLRIEAASVAEKTDAVQVDDSSQVYFHLHIEHLAFAWQYLLGTVAIEHHNTNVSGSVLVRTIVCCGIWKENTVDVVPILDLLSYALVLNEALSARHCRLIGRCDQLSRAQPSDLLDTPLNDCGRQIATSTATSLADFPNEVPAHDLSQQTRRIPHPFSSIASTTSIKHLAHEASRRSPRPNHVANSPPATVVTARDQGSGNPATARAMSSPHAVPIARRNTSPMRAFRPLHVLVFDPFCGVGALSLRMPPSNPS